ncbi:hypothetical protein BBD39_06185 [Arsenophonus endosymbiont of Bemisia tabaci Asia II 3]|nr:hypothetical protein BBD39_06185 [Arsenophonus endosymbiont of Bemisia tabaci Asia II 3]
MRAAVEWGVFACGWGSCGMALFDDGTGCGNDRHSAASFRWGRWERAHERKKEQNTLLGTLHSTPVGPGLLLGGICIGIEHGNAVCCVQALFLMTDTNLYLLAFIDVDVRCFGFQRWELLNATGV